MLRQAFASALGLEEMLIPEDALKRWGDGMPLPAYIDDVVAGTVLVQKLSHVIMMS